MPGDDEGCVAIDYGCVVNFGHGQYLSTGMVPRYYVCK